MTHYKAYNPDTGVTDEYDADTPKPEQLLPPWNVAAVYASYSAPDAPPDTRMYLGRRTLTKLEFIALLGETNFEAILTAAKSSTQIESFVKQVDLSAFNADGTSLSLDDPRTVAGLNALEAGGVIAAGEAARILNG